MLPGPPQRLVRKGTYKGTSEVPLRVRKLVSRLLLAGAAVLFATLSAQTARADDIFIDFACSANCNGGVTATPDGNFSTTGITVSSLFYPGGLFTLAFDTSTDAISIIGQGALSGEVFSGQITSFQSLNGTASTDVDFSANWPTIPLDAQAYFGKPSGTDSGFAIFLSSSGTVTSADVTITPAPEPGAPILLSAGLAGLGFLMKRKGALPGLAAISL